MQNRKSELLSLMNAGPAIVKLLALLNITRIDQLQGENAHDLYEQLVEIRGKLHPCVEDVLSAIIFEAQTGIKKRWWHWTKVRKGK